MSRSLLLPEATPALSSTRCSWVGDKEALPNVLRWHWAAASDRALTESFWNRCLIVTPAKAWGRVSRRRRSNSKALRESPPRPKKEAPQGTASAEENRSTSTNSFCTWTSRKLWGTLSVVSGETFLMRMAGRRDRSTLPLALSGNGTHSFTTALGTMYGGSCSTQRAVKAADRLLGRRPDDAPLPFMSAGVVLSTSMLDVSARRVKATRKLPWTAATAEATAL
mmetsp:Transcript_48436/g.65934  ORF Transcript_48436/g.65934 Transcript_48436/m.65934 type:complete len:223 (-) Transcript_48436:124-792(-)